MKHHQFDSLSTNGRATRKTAMTEVWLRRDALAGALAATPIPIRLRVAAAFSEIVVGTIGALTGRRPRSGSASRENLMARGDRRTLCVVATLVLCGASAPLYAQTLNDGSIRILATDELATDSVSAGLAESGQVITQPAGPAPTPRHTGVKAMAKDLVTDVKHLPSKENLFWVGVGGGLALAAHPADDNVNEFFLKNDSAKNFFVLGKYLGQLYTLLPAALTVYAVGRAKDQPKVSHLGMDLIQALVIDEALVQSLKYTTRRERPDGSGKNSFPSGHAAGTFAFATALERHLGWKGAVPAYLFSSYVAISRLPDDKHWLSDVVFGASVGIIAGRTVTRHGREYPVTINAVPGGAAIMFVRRGQ